MTFFQVYSYNGKPHWGKTGFHYLSTELLDNLANKEKFLDAMKKYSPGGGFLNAFGRRLLGTSNSSDTDPLVSRCALQDYCICERDEQCGIMQVCSTTKKGFRICTDDQTLITQNLLENQQSVLYLVSVLFSIVFNSILRFFVFFHLKIHIFINPCFV